MSASYGWGDGSPNLNLSACTNLIFAPDEMNSNGEISFLQAINKVIINRSPVIRKLGHPFRGH